MKEFENLLKSKKTKIVVIILIIIILGLSFHLTSKKTVVIGLVNEKESSSENNVILASEEYSEGKIDVKYPQITQLSSEELRKTINDKIREEVFKLVEDIQNDKKVLVLEIEYDVKRIDDKVLSILFEGYINAEGSPYPMFLSFTLNINMDNGEEIDLKNYFKIDEKYVEQYHLKKLNILKLFQNEAFEGLSDAEILIMFSDAEFYLTKDSLGLVVFVSHSIGDYVELEIKYDELKNIIESNTEWESLVE